VPKQVLFVQGAGEGTYEDWDNKLVRDLERELGSGYAVLYPRMPDEAQPRYSAWKKKLLDTFHELEDGAIVVGHSFGGAVLIQVLAEHPPKCRLGAISLIAAPFMGEGGWPSDHMQPMNDMADRLPADVPVLLYHGVDDRDVPPEHLSLYVKAIPQAVARVLEHRDHQLNDDLSEVARDIRSVQCRNDEES